jgi:hypothetical protein
MQFKECYPESVTQRCYLDSFEPSIVDRSAPVNTLGHPYMHSYEHHVEVCARSLRSRPEKAARYQLIV